MTKAVGKASGSTAREMGASGRFVDVRRNARSGQSVEVAGASGPVPTPRVLAHTRLKKAGGSLVMTVPAVARSLLQLTEGQEMAVSVEGNRVVLEAVASDRPMRVRRPKYTLDQLIEGADPAAQLSDEERAWHDAAPMGRETW